MTGVSPSDLVPDGGKEPTSAAASRKGAIDESEIIGNYVRLMDDVKWRTEALRKAIQAVNADRPDVDNILSAELAYLQMRRICEAIAIGVLVAHQQISAVTTNRFMDAWNADTILGMLDRINEQSFPMRIEDRPRVPGQDGPHYAIVHEDVLTKQELRRVYNRCGAMLHVGSLKKLLKGQVPVPDLQELIVWHNGLLRLLSMHVISLPEFGRMLICWMKGPGGLVHVAFSDLVGTIPDPVISHG